MAHFDASVSSPWAPESGVAAYDGPELSKKIWPEIFEDE